MAAPLWAQIASTAHGGLMDTINVASNLWSLWRNQKNWEISRDDANTAVQRRVADLKAAGINPILAAGQDSTTIPPVRAEGTNLHPNLNIMEMLQQSAQLGVTQEEEKRIRAEKEQTAASANLIREQAYGQFLNNRNAEATNPLRQEILKLESEFQRATQPYRIRQTILDNDLRITQIDANRIQQKLYNLDLDKGRLDYALKELELALQRQYGADERQSRLLALDWANNLAETNQLTADWNLSYAERHGRPVGSTQSGLPGQLIGLVDYLIGSSR